MSKPRERYSNTCKQASRDRNHCNNLNRKRIQELDIKYKSKEFTSGLLKWLILILSKAIHHWSDVEQYLCKPRERHSNPSKQASRDRNHCNNLNRKRIQKLGIKYKSTEFTSYGTMLFTERFNTGLVLNNTYVSQHPIGQSELTLSDFRVTHTVSKTLKMDMADKHSSSRRIKS